MRRIINRLRPQSRAELVAARDRYRRELVAERIAAAELRAHYDQYRRETAVHVQETIGELRAQLAVRALPEPVQALVDWYLRKPMTAVLDLPSRDSIEAALAGWQPAPRSELRALRERMDTWTSIPNGRYRVHAIIDCLEGHCRAVGVEHGVKVGGLYGLGPILLEPIEVATTSPQQE